MLEIGTIPKGLSSSQNSTKAYVSTYEEKLDKYNLLKCKVLASNR